MSTSPVDTADLFRLLLPGHHEKSGPEKGASDAVAALSVLRSPG